LAGESSDAPVETYNVAASCEGERVDSTLALMLSDYSRARIQTMLRDGHILVDGSRVRPASRLTGFETVSVYRPPAPKHSWNAQNFPITTVYTDADVIVVNKRAGLVVHPGAGNPDGTLVNALLSAFPELSALPRAGIVHRLDKDTSGLMVVARSELAHKVLVQELSERRVSRKYLALARGSPVAGASVDAPIGRDRRHRTRMAVVSDGREAITHFKVREKFGPYSLLRVQLETGRTHQIRVHLAHIGLPLVGDPVYGGRPKPAAKLPAELRSAVMAFQRQALHAEELAFMHPREDRECLFKAPLPVDMHKLIAVLRAHDFDE